MLAMRCDICGAEIPKNQEVHDTRNERFGPHAIGLPIGGFPGTSYPKRPKGFHPRKTLRHLSIEVVPIVMCPACAQRRASCAVWAWIALGLFFCVGTAITILSIVSH